MPARCEQIAETIALQLNQLRLSQIPPNWVAAPARYTLGSKAPLLERTVEAKRRAMGTPAMWHLQAKAIDEALELFQVLVITQLPGTTKRTKERLSIPHWRRRPAPSPARRERCSRSRNRTNNTARHPRGSVLGGVEEAASRAAVLNAAARRLRRPSRGGVDAEDLAVPVGVDADRDERLDLMLRPPSRTLWVNTFTQTNASGPGDDCVTRRRIDPGDGPSC